VVNGKGQLDIDLGAVPKGIYSVMIQNKDNRIIRKIIVSK
jgi:hypothetical protein